MATLKKNKIVFLDRLSRNACRSKVLQNAPRGAFCILLTFIKLPFVIENQGEHSAIFLTFIKLPFVIKTFVLSIFDWPFYTGFTVGPFPINKLKSS